MEGVQVAFDHYSAASHIQHRCHRRIKGGRGPCPPELGPQQVPAEAIWRLENASEPFSDLDFAPHGPRWGTLQHSPDLPAGGEGTGCLPTNPLPLSALCASGFGPFPLAPDPKYEAWPLKTRRAGSADELTAVHSYQCCTFRGTCVCLAAAGCLRAGYTQLRTLQKRLNRSRCRLGNRLLWERRTMC